MPLSTKIQCTSPPYLGFYRANSITATVWSAVHEIENTMNIRYPRSFPTIEEVKAYIDTICAKHDFNYHLSEKLSLRPTDQHTVVHKIKDQVRYIVAARAHKHGEFYLDEPLPDRKVLRSRRSSITFPTRMLIKSRCRRSRHHPCQSTHSNLAHRVLRCRCCGEVRRRRLRPGQIRLHVLRRRGYGQVPGLRHF